MINTAEEFIKLRSSEIEAEYWQATHDEAPLEVWLDVIEKYPEFREWVAHNKTVPIKILQILADDPDKKVRSMVSMKNKLPEELQLKLARDPDESVRLHIAYHKKATRAVLEILLDDEWSEVREQAKKRISTENFKRSL